ncbi:MAG: MBL fold metallo-hydrolase [Rhizobiaceae bacterium]
MNELPMPETGAMLAWLGQAGFLIAMEGQRIVVDAYLSDSLAEKYRGKVFPHIRMMPPPIAPASLQEIDWLLCTHGHTDHMDPGTIPTLLAANPDCKVVAPRSEAEKAIDRGVPRKRLYLLDAGETLNFGGIEVLATAAAHEKLERDTYGNHLYLGYVLSSNTVTVWHSGDTIPFAGLQDQLQGINIDLALLPINGRDGHRAAKGVPGNLTVDEALELTDAISAGALICHHYGMFEFNTADPAEALQAIDQASISADVQLAQISQAYTVLPNAVNRSSR